MLIVCPSCATSYDVRPENLSPIGRQVRCARCRTVWHAEPDLSEKLLAAAAAIAPDQDVAAPAADRVAEKVAAMSATDSGVEMADAALSDQAAATAAIDQPTTEQHDSSTTGLAEPDSAGAAREIDGEAPPIVPADPNEGGSPIEVAAETSAERAREPAEDVEAVAARRQQHSGRRRTPGRRLSRLQIGTLALALVNIILVGWRSDVVRVLPQTASFYALLGLPVNLRGLTFSDVVTSTEQHEGVPILVVDGNIVNRARKVEGVPRLKFIVRNAARQEIYSWTAVPSRNALASGEALSFRARLASPPPDAHDLVVRFVNRRDMLAGTH